MDSKIENALNSILDIASSGCGSWDDWHYKQFQELFETLSETEKKELWDVLLSHIVDSDGWSIEEIRYLMKELGVTECTIKISI